MMLVSCMIAGASMTIYPTFGLKFCKIAHFTLFLSGLGSVVTEDASQRY